MKLGSCISITSLILLSSCSTFTTKNVFVIEQSQTLPVTATANIKGKTIQLEVARSPQQQAAGLMYREFLADDRGMMFPFEEERVARLWMKNVPISLDLIFINGDRIVGIAADVPPCTADPCPIYSSQVSVDRVIELRSGKAADLGAKLGDRISINFLTGNYQQKSY